MTNFEKWDNEFKTQNMFAFNFNANALLWLKVRAICRGKQLRQFLKANAITLSTSKIADQNIELFEKLLEIGKTDILNELNDTKREVINEAQTNPIELMTWLYSNQGEMRFGAENRLFLILIDSTDMTQSWKMKRAFSLIEPQINDYLDNFNDQSLTEINFSFKGNRYKSLADTIFVVK